LLDLEYLRYGLGYRETVDADQLLAVGPDEALVRDEPASYHAFTTVEEFIIAGGDEVLRQIGQRRPVNWPSRECEVVLFGGALVDAYAEAQGIEPAPVDVQVGIGRPGQSVTVVPIAVRERPVEEVVVPVGWVGGRVAGVVGIVVD